MFYDGLGSLSHNVRGFEVVADEFRKYPNVDIQLPTRSDARSAGYDFYLPCDIRIHPGERMLVFTDVKAFMQEDEVLMLYVRSSIGIKKGLVLSNAFNKEMNTVNDANALKNALVEVKKEAKATPAFEIKSAEEMQFESLFNGKAFAKTEDHVLVYTESDETSAFIVIRFNDGGQSIII